MLIKIGKIELEDWITFGDAHWIRIDPNATLYKPERIDPNWDRMRVNLAKTFSRFDSTFDGPLIWYPFFHGSLRYLQSIYDNQFFREFLLGQEMEAKNYIDDFLLRINKLTAFL